ncbi:MAG TPA: hypothetical protein VJR23_12500 [Candidatus Acidoferrales bacterium]|nr:hypothetical protein [Candidatus Acidoferrales bacterium]
MPEAPSQPTTQRRRSERVTQSLPIIVRGVDLLGQPFEERTATLTFNLHGCRYPSRYHLPKNTWVTIEITHGAKPRNVRARVAWVQRPRSVRELFQIAVELESSGNIWEHEPVPSSWTSAPPAAAPAHMEFSPESNLRVARESESAAASKSQPNLLERIMAEQTNNPLETILNSELPRPSEAGAMAESPLLRELRAALESQARQSVEAAAAQANEQIRREADEIAGRRAASAEEYFHRVEEEFEAAQRSAREHLAGELAARKEEILAGVKAELDGNLQGARKILEDLSHKVDAIRSEGEAAAAEATSRVAQLRLQMEAAEASRASQAAPGTPPEELAAEEAAVSRWRGKLELEMAVAQSQWNELLQSSLDSGIERLAGQLSERTQEFVRSAEQKTSERLAALQQPFHQISSEAGENLAAMRASLDAELSRARMSLGDIEHAASRMKEYSAQLEAASHDALNELHRRLEKILETHTDEMSRRVEALATGLPQRVAPSLDSLGRQFIDHAVAEVESKLTPHLERVPALLRELSSREVQSEEALRLHRERLRQLSENSQREMAAQIAATIATLRSDFEAARKESLAKWNEELEAGGVRAAHGAAESISKTSEWLQQEARARLQVIVEQGLAAAGGALEEKTIEAAQKVSAQIEAQSSGHVAQVQHRLDALAAETEGRAKTQLELAAEEAAASFGQVLRHISDQETVEFTNQSRAALRERAAELEFAAGAALRSFEANAATSLQGFQAQLAAQVETGAAEGRRALEAESAAALNAFRGECAAHEKELTLNAELMTREAASKFQERLETAGDSWIVSSIRRLNEYGQDSIESMMRSADQTLRDSCAKFFESLAQSLRERTETRSAAAFPGFPEQTPPPAEPASNNPS